MIREVTITSLIVFDWFVLIYFVVVNSFYTLLLIFSVPEIFKNFVLATDENLSRLFSSEAAPPIALIAPAYNEEATIADSLHAMLSLQYPILEIVVVNDGSKDGTMQALHREFDLFEIPPIFKKSIDTNKVLALYRSRKYPGLVVVDKENGGKADALNAGLNIAAAPLICAVDADTLIEPDALVRIIRPFYLSSNVIAAGGTIRIANGCRIEKSRVVEVRPPRKFIPSVQVVEYLRAFLFGRLGLNRLGGNLVISGAFGLFRKDIVIAAGGWLKDTVGEDIELVVRLHRYMLERKLPYVVEFIPDPVAWTESPETMSQLGKQRDRWHRGLTDTLVRHRKMMFNPKYGAIGMIVYPYFVIVELLSPPIELIGYIGLVLSIYFNAVDWFFAALFFVAAYGLGTVLSLFSIVLEEASFRRYNKLRYTMYFVLISLIETFGYRHMSVWWRCKGMYKYFAGVKTWGGMQRKGFKEPSKA